MRLHESGANAVNLFYRGLLACIRVFVHLFETHFSGSPYRFQRACFTLASSSCASRAASALGFSGWPLRAAFANSFARASETVMVLGPVGAVRRFAKLGPQCGFPPSGPGARSW